MSLPPLVTVDELETRLGRTLTAAERTRATAVVQDVSAVIRAEAGGVTWTTTDTAGVVVLSGVPDVVAVVALTAARRAFENPDGVVGTQLGSYSERLSSASAAGVFLTDEERAAVQLAVGGLRAVGTVRVPAAYTLGRADSTYYAPVDYGGQPIPLEPL